MNEKASDGGRTEPLFDGILTIGGSHRDAFEVAYETTSFRMSRFLYVLTKPLFLLPGSRRVGWSRK
jgi:hypothetical protein